MDDGLAERLFNAFWDPLVARGWPRPSSWSDLHPTQRDAWEQVAIAVRAEFAERRDAEVQMLRDANDAWQRTHAELQAEIDRARSVPRD